MTIQKLHLPDTGNAIALFSIAALIGGLGWGGNPALHFLALLYPFVYIHSRSRFDTPGKPAAANSSHRGGNPPGVR